MEFNDVIRNRFSCKKYSGKMIDKEVLLRILECGRVAPTAKNLQEQHIYVISDSEKLAIIDEVTPCRYGAPVVLVVAVDKDNDYTYPDGIRHSAIEDGTIVATHMLLGAYNEGVDSCWINCFLPEALKKKLGLPANEETVMLMDLGYGEIGPLANHTNRKDLEMTVTFYE